MTTQALAAWRQQLRPAAAGLVLAVLTLLYGHGLGIVFGINEDSLKQRLKASAEAVRDTAYKGDEAAIKAVLEKSWAYMKRAHLHAGGMGTTAIALILLLPFVGASGWTARIVSLALGAGGLGYSVYWMWAGFRAPGMGSTDAAKESLEWLAMPSSIGFVAATIWMLILLAGAWRTGKPAPA